MKRFKRELKDRNARILDISRYFRTRNVVWNKNITCSLCEHFAQVIKEGQQIIYFLDDSEKVSSLPLVFKSRINAYLEDGEKAISVLGENVLEEFCDLLPVVTYLGWQRLLLVQMMEKGSDDINLI